MKKWILILILVLIPSQVFGAKLLNCKFDDGTDALKECSATLGAIAINTDWFPADLRVGLPRDARRFTFQFNCPTESIVSLQVEAVDSNLDAITETEWDFNAGVALTAGAGYQFSWLGFPSTTFNIHHESGTQNCKVLITREKTDDL